MTNPARQRWVEEYVREHCFGEVGPSDSPLTFGAELEWLVFNDADHTIVPVYEGLGAVCSLDVVRQVARRLSWCESRSDKGVPKFASDYGGSLTFEPGGQIEYASAVHHSVNGVLRELSTVERALRESAEQFGVILLARGTDPFNGPEMAPLQLTAPRYSRMARYFAGIGPDGARMMRQTASLQLNIGGIPPLERWPVANAMAPWLVALFANSAMYAGNDTGCASYRAETWRGVDPSRTGVFAGSDAVREYADFALNAPAFLADDCAAPFALLHDAVASNESLATHLTTLFPDVRPRRYLELRSIDAIDGEQRGAAMALVAGVLGDDEAARDAADLLGCADLELLRCAGRLGLRDTRIAARAGDLIDIGLAGCARLGFDIVDEEACEALKHSVRTRTTATSDV